MTVCRFENAIQKEALALYGLIRKIEVRTAAELPSAMAEIENARKEGRWVALQLGYSLGAWLEPALMDEGTRSTKGDVPRMTALVFERAAHEPAWESPSRPQSGRIVNAAPRIGLGEYRKKISDIKHWLENGDVYQINLTFPIDVEIEGSPELLYREIINRHPVAHAAFIDDGESQVLSFSPELFLSRSGSILTSRPMKGTSPRHRNPEQDLISARTLQASTKDRAENAMIVDLLRNDMGKIARTGSVKVEKLFDLECYPSIWTLTSTIKADIGQASFFEILRALFPCGSVIGAPKIAAMRYIRQLEREDRGLYCGSIGWMAPNGDFSLNVAIRTLVLEKGGAGVYGVGGGVVLDSEADLEWSECQWKSRVLGNVCDEGWA
ncbi:aminodeoxychorismate synthase component I [Burkholderia stagnalis]|uniref:aminodeoxychorismate synthase component I n=1 Tax=Burkholderia stagnalis TaxID=1503054 RepID=UPI000755FDB4|nr:aminodeoxychorismate synthase component I [Burkholderia stagnalis]AOK55022.1 aminodeoxychorismate synthase component I [Burkholderia stagnalis]KVL87864.1 aminodeoxychorismate synthase component I [Burkholderia stagnalis]KVM07410.1 aminodeoxychorismate synthase component I [Burkholderia stagnalis]KVN02552.1 aminodeoxychorismate synthase component I [Burkholderia stagnalis]KVN17316.1 aminodeoxychorismate synthase component I [Burkholderia stagnalis]